MVDITMALPEGTRAYLLAPIVRDRKGEYRKEFQDLRKQGFQRVKVNGEFHDLDAPPELDKKYRHNIDVVVDRIVVREGLETRLADSLRTALDLADGIAILETAPPGGRGAAADHLLGEFACPVSGFTIPEIEPRLFSFNAPFGACPACDGLGVELFFDPRLIVPDEGLTLMRGAIAPWAKGQSPYYKQTIEALAQALRASTGRRSWRDLPEQAQAGAALRVGGREDPLPLRRGRAGLRDQPAVRGGDPQHGAALPRDRLAPGRARRWSATRTTGRAGPATGSG